MEAALEYIFSVWYTRLVRKKVLFGLLGEQEKVAVIDKAFDKAQSYELLDRFLNQDYAFIEHAMKK